MWNRVARALAAIFAGQALVALANVLLVPLYLAHWSPILYGEWTALFSLVSYLTALDLGVSVAVANQLTQLYTRGAFAQYRQVFHSGLAFYLAVTAVGTLALFVGGRALPLTAWLGVTQLTADDARWVLLLLGTQILFAMPLGLLGNVYRSVGDVAKMTWIGNVQRGAASGLVAVGLVLDADVRTIALLQLVPAFSVAIYCWVDTSSRFPQIRPGFSEASITFVGPMVRPGLLFMLIMLAQAIAQQGPVIAVSSLLGGTAVAVLATSRTLTNTIRMLVNALSQSLWPDITGLDTRGEAAKLRGLHRAAVAVSTILSAALAAALWYEGGDVIRTWTQGRLQPDTLLLRALLAQMVLQSPWLASSFFTIATNRHARLSRFYLASSVIGLAVAVPLVGRLGLWGIGIGLIVGEALACYHFVIRDTCRTIGEPYGQFALKTWLNTVAVVAVAMLSGWAASTVASGPHVLRWLEVGFATSASAGVTGWVLWLDQDVKDQVSERARLLLRGSPSPR
jgi:O-antigen/teichoic acid export membrane protein